MNVSRKEKAYNSLKTIQPAQDKGKIFTKRNQQLMRNREIDALVEISRQVIMDKYIDLEN